MTCDSVSNCRLFRRHLRASGVSARANCLVRRSLALTKHCLQNANSERHHYSDPKERAHFWLPGSESTSSHELLDSALTDRMYIDAGDVLRVRVEADEFHDDEPGPPKAHEGVQQVRESRRPPYTITVRAAIAERLVAY